MSPYKNFSKITPCLLAIIIDALSYGLVYLIFTGMFETPNVIFPKGTSKIEIDFAMSIAYLLYPLMMFFGASLLGDLSDRYGRKLILLLCMVGLCVSFIFMGIGAGLASLTFLFVGRGLSGLMAGSQPIAQAAIVDVSTPETKAFNMSMVTLVGCSGLVIGPLIGGIFSDPRVGANFGYYTPFYISAGLALISYLLIQFGFKETFIPKKNLTTMSFVQPIRLINKALKHNILRLMMTVYFLMQLSIAIYYQFILISIKDRFFYTNLTLGLFYGFFGCSLAFGVLVVLRMALKHLTIEKLAILALFVMGIAIFTSAFHEAEWIIWALTIPIGIANVVSYATIITIFSNAVDKDSQGWVMGIFGSTTAFGFIVAGLSTNMLDLVSAGLVIAAAGVISLISGLLMTWIFKYRLPNKDKQLA